MIDLNIKETDFELIPAGTLAKARLVLKPGNSPVDPYLTQSKNGNNHYLNCEFIIMEGEYAKRKIFHRQIVESDNERSVYFGKIFIKHLLESANGIKKHDESEEAMRVRTLNNLSDLDGLEVAIRIGINPAGEYKESNKVLEVITADNPKYAEAMGLSPVIISDEIPF